MAGENGQRKGTSKGTVLPDDYKGSMRKIAHDADSAAKTT